MRVDGTDLLQLTFDGENKDPDWSKKEVASASRSVGQWPEIGGQLLAVSGQRSGKTGFADH